MQTHEEKVDLKQYLYDLLVVEKRTSAQLEQKRKEAQEWHEKAAYASGKGQVDLAAEAAQFAMNLEAEMLTLEKELQELAVKIQYCKDQVAKPSFTPLVDINQLQAEFEMLLGDEGKALVLDKKINDQKVDDDLAKLKRQMGL
ncbi:MAG: hypothetical protein D6675_14625 [Gemmatimonadetes bacterium]|nr:MAG: hypothetical protein D6675_14625 [Gemmatimonadota bacterium]